MWLRVFGDERRIHVAATRGPSLPMALADFSEKGQKPVSLTEWLQRPRPLASLPLHRMDRDHGLRPPTPLGSATLKW